MNFFFNIKIDILSLGGAIQVAIYENRHFLFCLIGKYKSLRLFSKHFNQFRQKVLEIWDNKRNVFSKLRVFQNFKRVFSKVS